MASSAGFINLGLRVPFSDPPGATVFLSRGELLVLAVAFFCFFFLAVSCERKNE